MSNNTIDVEIVRFGERHDLDSLKALLLKTSVKSLQTVLAAKLGRNDFAPFWNYLLLGLDPKNFELREKRFACVKCFLDNLLKIELTYKQTYDLITRLCQDLATFTSVEIVEIYEHCIDGIRLGDPKCVGWKDLLPETINVIRGISSVNVNGVNVSGAAYYDRILENICMMRWPTGILTPIANMFKDLELENKKRIIVLKKFSGVIDSLAPTELPALCFQIFSMCTTASQIVIILLALENYFHRYYYKKLFSDMNSNSTDFDSIDKYSDAELREAQETILHHLNYCTQYKITELQMCVILRNFQAMPDAVLTPFMLSAIISMTAANREPDSRLSTSALLPFLRSVIKNNEDERIMGNHSVWCRDSLQRKEVDLVQVFTVLIDQNKEGKDIITPGLVNLAFVLLKSRNNTIVNNVAIAFLVRFIKRRFIFGQGVVKKLAEWMVLEQDQYQYSESLTQLSVADTFTVSECTKTINYVMDFFLWIPGEQAMRMMSFILPILKLSPKVRDAFIDVLRKAMNSSDVKTRRMAIYGFCMILKQLNNSNSVRTQLGSMSSYCTQHSISGFSLMSQATLGNRNNPQRHFDMLTLEIIGVLRDCFTQSLDIKITLYENLQRAVELNPKLSPHILQFIDWHFRSYFDCKSEDDLSTELVEFSLNVKFDAIVQSLDVDQNEIIIKDNLGRLILFVAHCLVIFEKNETDYDTRGMKDLLKMSLDKIVAKELKFEEMTGSMTHYKHALITQQINFIEGIMAWVLLSSQQTNNNVRYLTQLFREHQRLNETLKKLLSNTKKNPKKAKNTSEGSVNVTVNGASASKIEANIENVWDLDVIEKLLRLLHEDIVPFAAPNNTTNLRSNVDFVRYVLEVATTKVEAISLEPEYKQLSHSKRTLKYLTDITKVVYERCIKRLPELWRDFDMKVAVIAAECFQHCLNSANKVYKKNFNTIFVKGFDVEAMQKPRELPATLHNVIDEYMREMFGEVENSQKTVECQRIPAALLLCLEVIYDNIVYVDSMTTDSYTWLLKFCNEYPVKTRQLCLVLKLLFTQRQKTHSGAFFNLIAQQLGKVLGRITDNDVNEELVGATQASEFKAINMDSAGFCFLHLFSALRTQIEEIEYFIVKANNSLYKHSIVPESDRDICLASLRSLQRSICTQLVHVSNAVHELANVCIPLGPSMDGFLKLLMQFYVCLKNLAKHFLSCVNQVSIRGSKFDFLLRVVGKPLPTRVYAMITYIESNILDDPEELSSMGIKKKINPKADKEKVLRETKQIPKLILCIENFNKHVILLSKRGNESLANYLHYGTARDFRVRTEELKAAISRTLSHSSEIETEQSEQGDAMEDMEDGEEVNENEEDTVLARMMAESAESISVVFVNTDENCNDSSDTASFSSEVPAPVTRSANVRARRILDDDNEEMLSPAATPTPDDVLMDVVPSGDDDNSGSQLIRNLKKVNKKAQKHALESERNTDPRATAVAAAAIPPETKRRRGRSSKK